MATQSLEQQTSAAPVQEGTVLVQNTQEVVIQGQQSQQNADVNVQQVTVQDTTDQRVVVHEWLPNQMFAQEEAQMAPKQPAEVIVNNIPDAAKEVVTQANTKESVMHLVNHLFGEVKIKAEDSPAIMLNKLSHFIMTSDTVSKEALGQLFSSKDMQQFLRDVLEGQMYLAPEEVADADKVKKLYERLESKTQRLEGLLNQAGLQDTPLAQTVSNVRGNVEFMNQLNQAYTYVQIPLKMMGQKASGQLYVYTSKRDLSDPDKELSAFLHLDLDHLGATDISVRMLRKKVDTKFYMETDEAFELVKAHRLELEERLRNKGFDAKIYVENEGKQVNFLDDFLKKDAPPTGQLHRYSFDVRA